MKKNIPCVLIALIILPFTVKAQHINDGSPLDSTTIRLNNDSIPNFIPDTAATPLWQIGRTHKTFFTTDTTAISMMTDTLHQYPVNANNWFIIKIPGGFNVIVDFWHKCQTDATHAGGIVEFSSDHGLSWQNIKGACNVDSFSFATGILTDNFYTFNDTLLTGEPSFTGTSGSTSRYSRFQFFQGFPVKPSGSSGCTLFADSFYVRFRFVSDSTTDSLAGWKIDSIKIEQDDYGGGAVTKMNHRIELHAYPNPSTNGLFTFPALANEHQFNIEVYNAMGARILKMPYQHSLDLSPYTHGLYYYKVTNGSEYYSGRLLIE
jgi:hypothetical protein